MPDQSHLSWPDQLMGRAAMSQELDRWAPDPKRIATDFTWARGDGSAWVHLSDDDGADFDRSVQIETGDF